MERALPALGFSGVANVHVGRLVELDVEDAGPARADVREAARQPARRGLRDHCRLRSPRRRRMKFGVLQFPGSCDERRRAAAPPGGSATPSCLWHGERDLRGADAIVVPGRLLLRRLPARRRDRALLAGDGVGDRASPTTAGSCWGSATAFRCCARRACCPGRCSATRTGASPSASSRSRWSTPTRRSRAPARAASELSVPAKHSWGRYYAEPADAAGDGGARPGGAALRARRRTSTARCTTSRACATRRGNVFGLMPHPEHAVDELTGARPTG